MPFTKVFKSGNSMAIRLPKGIKFDTNEVEIFRRGNEVIIRERQTKPTDVFDILASLPADFMVDGRQDPPPETRESW
ncbi:type II toxin-antitoxin system VapB family antitoxin [Methyloglobulus sp.]|uniref:antitoxin n=1 Tax=Methyloglobulus sp. TaxID=2518622 RepID=UPI0032B72864